MGSSYVKAVGSSVKRNENEKNQVDPARCDTKRKLRLSENKC